MKKLITTICLLGLMVLLISGCGRSGHDGVIVVNIVLRDVQLLCISIAT